VTSPPGHVSTVPNPNEVRPPLTACHDADARGNRGARGGRPAYRV